MHDHHHHHHESRADPEGGFSLAARDVAIGAVLTRLRKSRNVPPHDSDDELMDPHAFPDYGFSINDDQGDFIYMLCRAIGACRVVDFATSIGVSALYLAAAMRDNGGGLVVGAELVEAKVRAARRNLEEAGLDRFADIRAGDARETLATVEGPLDFVLIDGWPIDDDRSLARSIAEILAPKVRIGGILFNDNGEEDYLAYVRDPANGFVSRRLPLNRGTEFSVRVA